MIKTNQQSGSALIFSLLLLSMSLAIALTLSAVFIPKIKLASAAKNSIAAVYAAESGLEWCLYIDRIGNTTVPVMTNGATIQDNTLGSLDNNDCSPAAGADGATRVKLIGTYRDISRALEVSF